VTPGRLLTGWLAAAPELPLAPDREEARRAAAEELSHREYQAARPGLLQQLLEWVLDALNRVRVPGGPGPSIALVVVVAVVLAAIVFAVVRAGRIRASRQRPDEDLFAGTDRSAADHRAAADRHSAAGEWDLAVLERFRALVRELEERAVLVPLPARTAEEASGEAGRWLPALAGDLAAAAHLFNEVRYGGRAADAGADRMLRRLDEDVRRAQPLAAAEESRPQLVAPS
jgi:hypothetical protein